MAKQVLSRLKSKVKSLVRRADFIPPDGNKRIYVFLSPDYGNYGDIAISYAQKVFFKKILPEYKIIEISVSKFYNYLLALKKIIKKDDIIVVMGGGNMTNIYEYYEEIRRQVVKSFPNNLIISFPQTISFTNDKSGKRSLRRSALMYSRHKNLVLFAIENGSYETMKKYFKQNEVFVVPDMVFYLKDKVGFNNDKSDLIGLCLRTDVEKLIDDDVEEKIRKKLKDYKFKIVETHTSDENIVFNKKDEQFLNFLNEIKNVRILITDRLHGMLFAYITGTPCLVFDNSNHKIRESYNAWLKDCNYIELIDEKDIDNLDKILDKIVNSEKNLIDLNENFRRMEEIIKKKIGEMQ